MPKGVASRTQGLRAEHIIDINRRVMELRHAGADLITLSTGDPHFDSPPEAVEALIASLQQGKTHYTASAGTRSLREAVAQYFTRTRGPQFNLTADNILVAPGCKPMLFATLMVLCQAGDEVIYANPSFPSFVECIKYSGATPVPISLHENMKFRFDVTQLEGLVTERTKVIVINSPHNPTGAVLTHDDVKEVLRVAKKYDLYILADEIYSLLTFNDDGEESFFSSFLSEPDVQDRCIVLDGVMKGYSMTGWRCGFGYYPSSLIRHMETLHMNIWSCVPEFIQDGAAAALRTSDLPARMRLEYQSRRDFVVKELNTMPFLDCKPPRGGLFVFVNISRTGLSSKEFFERALTEFGVVVIPGDGFGTNGEGYIRISFAIGKVEDIGEGLVRLRRLLVTIEEESKKIIV